MKTMAKACLSNRECPVQEAVYHVLPELKLRSTLPTVYFVNTNPPEERVQVLLSGSKLPDDSPNIFKKSSIDHYMERPSATFCNRKYSIIDDFCYKIFLAYYTFENKSSKYSEYQPDELNDNLTGNSHEECPYPPPSPPLIKWMISEEACIVEKANTLILHAK